jgi:uncharacterized repeat protein (TIGR01451 family)
MSKGIEVWYQTQNALIENNTITNMYTAGIGLNDGSDNNTIRRNIITGTTGDGANGGAGVLITSFNDTAASPPIGNQITENAISGNAGLGIDLDARVVMLGSVGDGVTANDAGDGDTGANNLQNYPDLTSVTTGGGNTFIAGTFNSTASTTFRLEFFSSNAADPEGEVYLGADTVTTDGAGNATINTVLAVAVAIGDVITATATDTTTNINDTSEFSNAVVVAAVSVDLSGTVYEDVNGDAGLGDAVTRDNVTVSLYQDGGDGQPDGVDDGAPTNVTTDGVGNYTFSGLSTGTYWVVVDSKTVTPSAGTGAPGDVWAEQTYGIAGAWCDDGAGGVSELGAAGACYGGQAGTVSDDASTLAGAEHVTRVVIAGSDVTGVNFGFSFNPVVNTRDDVDDDAGANRWIQGSLRQFILNGNAITGTESSVFRIPTSDPGYNGSGNSEFTIQIGSALPAITDPIVLDGYTQPGAQANTVPAPGASDAVLLIELDGSGAGAVDGIAITAANSTVRGLVINGFGSDGIDISGGGATSNVIEGNYIGTDVTGTAAPSPNLDDGIDIRGGASTNTIGGTTPGARNIISGNGTVTSNDGIHIQGAGTTNNVVQGNFIGTDVSGSVVLGNAGDGVFVSSGATNNVIGGTAAGAGNLISGNADDGIQITNAGTANNRVEGNLIGTDISGTLAVPNADGDGVIIGGGATDNIVGGTVASARNVISGNGLNGILIFNTGTERNLIQGNYIGTDINGTAAVANTQDGVLVRDSAANNTIGGTGANEDNIIAFNGGNGVVINNAATINNLISRNAIFSNTGLGIDLGADGVTGNDAGDGDIGPNNLQNYPDLTAVGTGGGNTFIFGTLNSTANTTFRLEFFSSNAADPEGEVYLGSDTVTTDGSGNATINTVLAVAVAVGDVITATATDTTTNINDTSEFSNAVTVVEATDLYVTKTVDNSTPNEGATVTYTITVTNNGPVQATTVSLTDLLPAGVTYSSDTPSQGAYVSGTGVWTAGTINSGANATLDIQATVDAGTSGSTITNNVTAVSLDQLDNNVTADDLSEDITVVSPNVTLSKSADRATAKPTEVITYTLTYGNTGTGDATNLVITDTIPANTTLVSGSITGGGTESGGVITWNLGVLAAGVINVTVQFAVTVDAGTLAGTLIDNEATANYDDELGTAQTPVTSNTVTVTVEQVGGVIVAPDQSGSVSQPAARLTTDLS